MPFVCFVVVAFTPCVRNMSKQQKSSVGRGLGTLGVLVSYGLARVAPSAGVRRLVSALGSPHEDTSMAAYMALTKLGPRNAPRLLEEAKKGPHTASLVQLLGDLGDPSIIPDLEPFAGSPDPEVASAARESIDALCTVESENA